MTIRALLRRVGDLVRSNRITRGLTQRALAERAGIVDKYVSEIERGKRDVPLSTLLALVEDGLASRLVIDIEDAHRREQPTRQLRIDRLASRIEALPDPRRTQMVEIVERMLDVLA